MTYEEIEKSFENSKFSEEQKTFIVAKSWYEFLQSESDEIEKKIISENEFLYPVDFKRAGIKKGDRITDINDICFLSKVPEEWKRFYDLYYSECKNRGIAKAYNEDITAEARKIYLQAGNILLDVFFEKAKKHNFAYNLDNAAITAIKRNLVNREKFLNLAMSIDFSKD